MMSEEVAKIWTKRETQGMRLQSVLWHERSVKNVSLKYVGH